MDARREQSPEPQPCEAGCCRRGSPEARIAWNEREFNDPYSEVRSRSELRKAVAELTQAEANEQRIGNLV